MLLGFSYICILESNSKQSQYEYASCVFSFVYESEYLLYTHKHSENTEQIDIEEQFSNEVKLFIWASFYSQKFLFSLVLFAFLSLQRDFLARV